MSPVLRQTLLARLLAEIADLEVDLFRLDAAETLVGGPLPGPIPREAVDPVAAALWVELSHLDRRRLIRLSERLDAWGVAPAGLRGGEDFVIPLDLVIERAGGRFVLAKGDGHE